MIFPLVALQCSGYIFGRNLAILIHSASRRRRRKNRCDQKEWTFFSCEATPRVENCDSLFLIIERKVISRYVEQTYGKSSNLFNLHCKYFNRGKTKHVGKIFSFLEENYELWHYRLWSFKSRDTKLERFLHKNQHTQRKLLNFENWTNGEPQ